MTLKKYAFLVTLFALSLSLISCSKCPLCKKFFCKTSKEAPASGFQLIDVRVGGGAKGLEMPKTSFTKNEIIWLTFDVSNITAVREKGMSYFWIREDLIIRDKDGAIVILRPDIINAKRLVTNKPVKFTNRITLDSVKDLKPGTYTITLLGTDLVGFQTNSKTVAIKLM